MIKNIIKSSLILAAGIMLFTSCNHDRNNPGYAYMPDMYYSEPYDAYTPNPVLKDSVTMLPPPEGTIPRGYTPYPYKMRSYPDQLKAGEELVNPVPVNETSLAMGKEQYDIYCANCHGQAGKGDGYLYTSDKFTAKPTSLVEKYVQGKPDGEIYHVITMGSLSGLMGPHGSQIKPENRWKIINYVRTLAK
jgi:mono/diheme cytochrome c family protein